jgi:LuxR family maltose regulon positive regulatory protein
MAKGKPNARVLPAKLQSPRLPQIHPRPRLIRLLDRASDRPLIWIEGAAGSGKTTLAAEYVRARKLTTLWYRFDECDADPAAFFYHLRQAVARISPRRRETLPLLTPAYLQGLPAFSRSFIEKVYARLRRPAALVLDNVHDLPAASVLRQVLPETLADAPQGVTILALSRTAPTAEFAALQASSRLSIVRGEDLSFGPEEARGLARVRGAGALSDEAMRRILERTGGWAAGLVLTLEHARAGDPGETPPAERDALFRYFATELLDRAAPAERELLLKTSVLSQVRPSHAAVLTGIEEAGAVLAEFVRRNFFTVRSGGAEPVYQYHPLFREFLAARLRETSSDDEFRELCRRAAALMADADDCEEAGALLMAAGDRGGLAALVLRHAEPLVRSGRYATLATWLAHVPAATIESEPWLSCWLAIAEFPRDPTASKARLLRTMETFRARGDAAALGVVFSMYVSISLVDFGNFRGFDRSLAELVAPITPETVFPSRDVELRVTGAMIAMLLWARPWREAMQPWVRKAMPLIAEEADPWARLQLLHHVALYHQWCGDPRRAEEVVAAAAKWGNQVKTDPLLNALWMVVEAIQGYTSLDHDRWERAIGRGIAIAEKHGLPAILPQTLGLVVHAALSEGDLDLAARSLPRAESVTPLGVNLATSNYRFYRGWEALAANRLPEAIEELTSGAEIAARSGAPFPEALTRALLGQALHEAGRTEEAGRNLAIVGDVAAKMDSGLLRTLVLLARADEALRRDLVGAAEAHLRQALPAIRERGVVTFTGWRDGLMARVLAAALRFRVETDYVVSLIQRHRLSPPSDGMDLENWPWPIRIRMLGRFVVQRDGALLGLKSPGGARPLDLLKALVSLGGRDVDESRVAAELWPNAEGDRAHRSLKVNVHRLRRLLGDDCVSWVKGHLSLDAGRVWIDAWALERILGGLEAALGAGQEDRIAAFAAKSLALNRGDFLRGDSSPSALAARDRLRARFRRVFGEAAEALLAGGKTAEASRLYEKAIEADPVAERFYQGLMRCHRDLGQEAEGLVVYRRCSEALRRELRMAPSTKTEDLRADLLKSPDRPVTRL